MMLKIQIIRPQTFGTSRRETEGRSARVWGPLGRGVGRTESLIRI